MAAFDPTAASKAESRFGLRVLRILKTSMLWDRRVATVVEPIAAIREFERRYKDNRLIDRPG